MNGYTSHHFFLPVVSGRACLLSPLLYVIIIEVLGAHLRAHPAICRLRLPSIRDPLSVIPLYADDTSVIAASNAAILAVFEVYRHFELGKGSKVNLRKCCGLWLGSWRGRSNLPVPISWCLSKIKVLGVFLGHGDLSEEHWRPCLDDVECCLNSWCSSALSFAGKALVINALALSKVWYIASLVGLPPWARLSLNKLVFNFFWSASMTLSLAKSYFYLRRRVVSMLFLLILRSTLC